MRIGIIGGGAIGLLFAGYLAKNYPITVYARRKDQSKALKAKGLKIINGDRIEVSSIQAETNASYQEEVLIVTVKQYQLQPIIEKLAKINGKTILFVQNGMGHLTQLKRLKQHHIYVGVVEHGALKIDDTTVIHSGVGNTVFSKYDKDFYPLNLSNILHSTDNFPFSELENWEFILKQKLLVNVCINPLTAILNIKNGELIENKAYLNMMKKVFQEAVTVLSFSDSDQQWENVYKICEQTADNTSSMLKDIQDNRGTEIEAIVGYLLTEAELKNKPLPLISFLYDGIVGKGIAIEGDY